VFPGKKSIRGKLIAIILLISSVSLTSALAVLFLFQLGQLPGAHFLA